MLAFIDKIPFGTPRLRRIAFWTVSTFIIYVLIGFFVIPPVVKSLIVNQSTSALRRDTSVDEVYFNPLTLHIEVSGVKINKLEGDGQLISVGSFTASPGIASIWRLAPVISYLHLRDLAVDITFFGDGKYSISDLFGKPTTEESQKDDASEQDGTVFPFALYGFEMTNATIVFDDRPHAKKHVISNLDLLVPFTSSFQALRKEFTQPKFTAVVNGDPVELKGRTLPFDDTLLTQFELGAVDVNLDQYWSYLPIESPLQLLEGRFTSDISLFFERPDAQRINLFLGGGGKLTDLKLAGPGDGTVLSLKELSFKMKKFSLGDKELELTNVTLDHPYFKVIRRKNNAINWASYFPGQSTSTEDALPPSPQQEAAQDNAPMQFDIKRFEIKEGSVEWHDQAVPGGFEHIIPNLSLVGQDISTDGETPCRFAISMGKDKNITLDGGTTMRPLAGTAKVTLKDILIPTYKPYLKKALPMTVDSGLIGGMAGLNFKKTDDAFHFAVDNATLSVDDLALSKPDAKQPSIGFKNLTVSGSDININKKTILVDEVRLTNPIVKVERAKSGHIDLVTLFQSNKDVVEEEKIAEKEAPKWLAAIKAVRMVDGAASYKDLSLKHPANLSIDTLKVDIGNVTTKKGETITYDVSTRWGGHGSISLKGDIIADTLKGSGRFQLRGMGLRPLDGHLGEYTELLFASGTASTDLKYQFSGGEQFKFTVAGNASLNKVQLKDNRGDGEFAGIDAFKLAGIRFANKPNRLSIADIHLGGPRVAIDFDETGRLNLRRAFGIPQPPPASEKNEGSVTTKKTKKKTAKKKAPLQQTNVAATSPKTKKPFFEAIDIGKVTMNKGRVTFRDASVHPVYYTEISDMKLGIIEISQAENARPKVDFSAKIGPTPMSVTGVVNPVITPIYSDLAIAVNGMELVPLTPYTIEHLAYPIEKGRLYADVTFKTEDWVLSADNKFFIEQLVLGPKDKRPNAPSVPVKFGLALLQDSNGDMELNLPIRGELNDPDFRIGGIVFKAIASLFVKALASPFTLIGSIFGGGGENMDFVVFEPGRHKLDSAGLKKLDGTAKALKERHKLKLEVDGVVDPIVDKSGLVEVIFEDKIKQQKFNSLRRKERAQTSVEAILVAPEEYEEFLFDAYKEEPDPDGVKPTTLFMTDRQPVEYMEKFILDRITVTEEDLNELAMRRATAVKEYVITQDDALTERVYLLDRRKNKQGKTGVPQHRADLGIK